MEFLRQHQLTIMVFLSGICCVLAILSFFTKALPKKRRFSLIYMEIVAALLLITDRYAYIYRGDTSELGWWMVRITNFCVYFFSISIIHSFNLYLTDLYRNEGKLPKIPKRLIAVEFLFGIGVILLIIAAKTGLYYTFDDTNHYQRAPGYFISYIFPFSSVILQLSVILQYYKRIKRTIRIPLLLFAILPIVATVVQVFTYGLSLQNITLVGEVIVLYIFVLVDMNNTVERANLMEVEFLREEQKNIHIMFEQTAEALANAIDAKDKYTHGHSARVAEYAKQIAILAGKSERECIEVYFAGLLHDVGKIGISESIINKNGKLNDQEYSEIKKHPSIGRLILSSITQSPYLSIGANFHHERYDGKGYPDGLKGDDIPELARIIAVADAYDAMSSKRSYRDTIPQDKVREEIVKGMGTQFDPVFAKCMLHLIDMDTEYEMKEHEEVKGFAKRNQLKCDEFMSATSEGILLNKNITKISFNSKTDQNFASLDSIPTFIIFDSLDARIHDTEKKKKDNLYFEFAQIRLDGQIKNLETRKIECNKKVLKELSKKELLELYKNGLDYNAELVKVKDHILIKITNQIEEITVTIALPDSSRYTYAGVTGFHCFINNVKLERLDEVVPDNYIPRIVEEISYIDGPQGDIPNVQVDGWRSTSSEAFPIKNETKITFHTMSLPTARLIWHCPYLSLFYSDDKKIDGPNYKEFVLIRIDGENWESYNYAQNTILINKTENFEGWDVWKEKNKKGMDCEITITRKANKIFVTTENAGIYIRSVTTLKDNLPEVYATLTGDQCAITNIRIS